MEIVRSKCARFCEILKYISTSPIISSYHPGSEKNIKRSCRVKPLCRPLHGKTIHLSMQTIFSSWQLTTQALRLLEKSCSEKKNIFPEGTTATCVLVMPVQRKAFKHQSFTEPSVLPLSAWNPSQNSKMCHANTFTTSHVHNVHFKKCWIQVFRSSEKRSNDSNTCPIPEPFCISSKPGPFPSRH